MSRKRLQAVVTKAALSNEDVRNEAISTADSYSWQTANPQFLRTAKNIKLINHYLQSKGTFVNSTYPDLQDAYEFLSREGMLDLDKAELAKQQDYRRGGHDRVLMASGGYHTFHGVLTARDFETLDEMIAAERLAALSKAHATTDEERELENLPIEQLKSLMLEAERGERLEANRLETSKAADAWISLHPEYCDTDRNAGLIRMQLAAQGITEDNATVEDYEIAGNQLREMLTLNKKAVKSQRSAEVKQLAADAISTPGSVFDKTTMEEMEALPLEEIRRRANAVMGRG
jgi:hypothetical protein